MRGWPRSTVCLFGFLGSVVLAASAARIADAKDDSAASVKILGLTGQVSNARIAVPAAEQIQPVSAVKLPADIDLKNMAGWAMNYLTQTPRKQLGYEPVFQCHPLQCPPIPEGQDPVVACDTDARMDWEWYFMRDITGSDAGREVEAAFHKRMHEYIDPDGKVWSHPGCYNESKTTAKYEKKDYVIHVWGATKILKSLSEDYARTNNPESKALATKVMKALKKIATFDDKGRCWFPAGMGALKPDGSVDPNAWNSQPSPVVEPLVTYWLATKDPEGLAFAKAYADGMIDNLQPDGIRFQPDGKVTGGFPFGPHSHATMHAVWGIADLGAVTGDAKYTEFARKVWDWMLTRGTGTGWFPAGPDSCNETCCISDMMSIAALVGRAGHPEYYDDVERYLRNYISNLQFIVTPEFEAYYREINKKQGDEKIAKGLTELRKFQGGVIGGSGPERLRERTARRCKRVRNVRLLCPRGHARDLHGVDRHDRSSPRVVAGTARCLRQHEFFATFPVGRGHLLHARIGPTDGQGCCRR